jgi:hypothetical protein
MIKRMEEEEKKNKGPGKEEIQIKTEGKPEKRWK